MELSVFHHIFTYMNVTDRKIEILKMLADGYKAREIGLQLGIAIKTVEKHVEILKTAYEAKNTPNLIHIAHRQKLIS